jgi:hypothetical protein
MIKLYDFSALSYVDFWVFNTIRSINAQVNKYKAFKLSSV